MSWYLFWSYNTWAFFYITTCHSFALNYHYLAPAVPLLSTGVIYPAATTVPVIPLLYADLGSINREQFNAAPVPTYSLPNTASGLIVRLVKENEGPGCPFA